MSQAAQIHPIARLPDEWLEVLSAWRQPTYRAKQIFRWIHARGVHDPDQMSDLPKTLREELRTEGLGAPLQISRVHPSSDGTRKLLLQMSDGMQVESVLLPAKAEDADAAAADLDDDSSTAARVTQCISTQVGCAMGCVFCASGIAGLKRHLRAEEIVGQVLLARSQLSGNQALRNIVYMGMGEPLHNYEAVARSIRLLSHPEGMGLSPRRLTVSTSGLVPEIDRLGKDFEGRVSLAISLHEAIDKKRSRLMPINDRYPLAELMASLRRYPLARNRHLTIEYTLVRHQNDSLADAKAMAKLLRGLKVRINLIPMNPIEHSELGPPPKEQVDRFQSLLRKAGYLCFVRRRRGDDVAAACGQLVMLGERPNARFYRRQPTPDES